MVLAQGVEHKKEVFLFFFFLIECVVMRLAVSERAKREMQNRESERAKREQEEEKKIERKRKKKEKKNEKESERRERMLSWMQVPR